MANYVLVHGAWHTGKELEPTAAPIRAAGHQVHTPTIAGNKPGDPKTVGLNDAIESIAGFLSENNLKDVILVGHSYGGMIITGVADRIRRLVYWNAFVPNYGESLNDLVPPPYVALFDQIAAQRGDGTVVLPFPIWREAFINDADLDTAQKAYNILNPTSAKDVQRQNFFEGQPGGYAGREIVC
jgi:pimeloyl-ACP methyl ester carboxylesterase